MIMATNCITNLQNEALKVSNLEYIPSEDNHDGGNEMLSRLAMFRGCRGNTGMYRKHIDLKMILLSPFILLNILGTLPNSLYMLFSSLARSLRKGANAAVIDPLLVNKKRDLFDIVIQEKFCSVWSGEVDEHQGDEYVNQLDNLAQQPNMEGYQTLIWEFHEICVSNYGNRLKLSINTVEKVKCEWLRCRMLTIIRACLLQGHHQTVIRTLRLFLLTMSSLPIDDELTNLLHLSIVNTDCELFNLLVDSVKPEDLYTLLNKRNALTAQCNIIETFDLPLSMAVWMGNVAAVKRLVECGAEMSSKDRKGDNVFHIMVGLEEHMSNKVENMYDQLISSINTWVTKSQQFAFLSSAEESQTLLYAKWSLIRERNDRGYTPLQLAAKLGSVKAFNKLLTTDDVYSFPYFYLGPFSECLYDISEIDPFFNSDKQSISVLEILSLCPTNKNMECLMVEPILSLIKDKWKNHRPAMLFWLIVHTLFMIIYSWTGYQEHISAGFPRNQTNITVSKYEFLFSDYMLVVAAVWYFILTSLCLVALIKSFLHLRLTVVQGIQSLKHLCTNIMLLYTTFSSLCLLFKYFEIDGFYWFQMLSILAGWFLTQLCMRVFKRFSFFNLVLCHVSYGDAALFTFLILLLCLGATLASAPVIYGLQSHNLELGTFTQTYVSFLRLGVGVADFTDLYKVGLSEENLILLLYLGFIFIVNLVLLNMLIGSMSDSYSKLMDQQDVLCIAARAGDIVLLERILPLPVLYLSASSHLHKVIRIHLPEGKTADRHVYLFPAKRVET